MVSYALLGNCKYEKVCPLCKVRRKGIISHGLVECPNAEVIRKTLELKFKLYGAKPFDSLDNKRDNIFSCNIWE